MLMQKAYETLNVKEGDDKEAIKKAFRKKAAALHPDKNPGNEQAEKDFKLANEAYRILIGEQRADDVAPVQDPFSRMNIDFNSIFGGNFQRGWGRHSQQTVEIKRFSKQLTFDESVLGGECKIEYTVKSMCKECSENKTVCLVCGGEGVLHNVQRQANFSSIFTQACPACGGAGTTKGECKRCENKGHNIVSKSINLKIPPIGNQSVSLRLAKAGNIYYANKKEINGDAVIDLIPKTVSPDGRLKIVGRNIVSKEKVRLDTLMFGGDITVSTVTEKQKLSIPEKSRAGSILHIKGYGVHSQQGKGDHLVELEIEYPKTLTEELKTAIKKAYED